MHAQEAREVGRFHFYLTNLSSNYTSAACLSSEIDERAVYRYYRLPSHSALLQPNSLEFYIGGRLKASLTHPQKYRPNVCDVLYHPYARILRLQTVLHQFANNVSETSRRVVVVSEQSSLIENGLRLS